MRDGSVNHIVTYLSFEKLFQTDGFRFGDNPVTVGRTAVGRAYGNEGCGNLVPLKVGDEISCHNQAIAGQTGKLHDTMREGEKKYRASRPPIECPIILTLGAFVSSSTWVICSFNDFALT